MSAASQTPSWITWTLRAAWLLALATVLFAGFHAADGDPLQWGSVFASVFIVLIAAALTCIWGVARVTTWVLERRRRRTNFRSR
jgi:ABC-type sulfate transport system permease component